MVVLGGDEQLAQQLGQHGRMRSPVVEVDQDARAGGVAARIDLGPDRSAEAELLDAVEIGAPITDHQDHLPSERGLLRLEPERGERQSPYLLEVLEHLGQCQRREVGEDLQPAGIMVVE